MEKEWLDIRAVFTAVFGLAKAAWSDASQPLKERRQDVEREAKGLTDGLHAEISSLEHTISMLDNFSTHEDHIHFLQVEGSSAGLENLFYTSENLRRLSFLLVELPIN